MSLAAQRGSSGVGQEAEGRTFQGRVCGRLESKGSFPPRCHRVSSPVLALFSMTW